MANVALLAPKILKWEGNFVNNPLVKGGATNKGVTLVVFQSFYGKNKTIEDLKNLTNSQFQEILKTLYWNKWLADNIENQSIANILVDWLWGSGIWGIKIPQRLLGVTEDGIVGSNTITALNFQDPKIFFDKIFQARKDFLNQIVINHPEQKIFLQGWLNRLEDFKF